MWESFFSTSKPSFKKIVSLLHLWLGLASGLVVFIVAVTGSLWAFESEISDLIYPYRNVELQQKPILPVSQLIEKCQPYFGKDAIRSIHIHKDGHAATLSHWSELPNGEDHHVTAYANPWTGEVLKVIKDQHNFFDYVIELHVNLMLGKTGKQLVDYATLFFLVLLISGIILWWPKNKNAATQRFWFKWKEGLKWKRKNYDLHNILGFYASFIIVFVAITGLCWGFEWMQKTVYYTATLGAEYKDWPDPQSTSDTLSAKTTRVEDRVVQAALAAYAKPWEGMYISLAKEKKDPIHVYVLPSTKAWYNSSSYYFDQRNGKLLQKEEYEKLNNGQKVRAMNYDLHIGKILGLTGQFLVFFASLIVASLPFTGFYIWWGRKKKEGKEKKKGERKSFALAAKTPVLRPSVRTNT